MTSDTITISVITRSGTNQYEHEEVLDLDRMRRNSNLREALVTHFKALAQDALHDIDPSINL